MTTAVHPGGERRPPVEAVDATRDRDHRLLGRVEGILAMRDHPPTQRVHAVGVAVEEGLQRATVATRRPGREVGVVVTQPAPATLLVRLPSVLAGRVDGAVDCVLVPGL